MVSEKKKEKKKGIPTTLKYDMLFDVFNAFTLNIWTDRSKQTVQTPINGLMSVYTFYHSITIILTNFQKVKMDL